MNVNPVQVLVIAIFGALLALMAARTIGDVTIFVSAVLERFRRARWQHRLWRDFERTLESDRRRMRSRRRVRV